MPEFIKNFADAWVQWWNASEPISRYLLWGHPVFFWARIGKLLEVVGALFIVIDWIGRDQINKVTAKLVIVVEEPPLRAVPKFLLNLLDACTGHTWRNLRIGVKSLEWLFHTDTRIRVANVLLILLGFVFDFLGS